MAFRFIGCPGRLFADGQEQLCNIDRPSRRVTIRSDLPADLVKLLIDYTCATLGTNRPPSALDDVMTNAPAEPASVVYFTRENGRAVCCCGRRYARTWRMRDHLTNDHGLTDEQADAIFGLHVRGRSSAHSPPPTTAN